MLADDLKVFYHNLMDALKTKLLGRELKKKVEVEKVVEIVKEIEQSPGKFVEDLGVASNPEDSVGQMEEVVSPIKEKIRETEDMEEGGQNAKAASNNEESEDEEFEDIENGDEEDFEFEPNKDVEEEIIGNNEIYDIKRRTLEEVEKKLENYNFRYDTFKKSSNNSYPVFTTLIDFYQKAHTQLGTKGYLCNERFLIKEGSKTEKGVF